MSEIDELYKKAFKEKEAILAKIKPLKVKEEEIRNKLAPIEAELRAVREAIVKIEQPRLAEVSRTLVALAPSGKKIMAEAGKIGVKT